MIRVKQGNSPLSSVLNSFHSQQSATDNAFALSVSGDFPPPPPPGGGGVFGVDQADPQPSSYPPNTTFFVRTSKQYGLTLGEEVSSAYITVSLQRSAGTEQGAGFVFSANRGYSGVVKKIWNSIPEDPLPIADSAFVVPPEQSVFYVRFNDSSDPVDFYYEELPVFPNEVRIYLVPRSLGLTANAVTTFRGIVNVCLIYNSNVALNGFVFLQRSNHQDIELSTRSPQPWDGGATPKRYIVYLYAFEAD